MKGMQSLIPAVCLAGVLAIVLSASACSPAAVSGPPSGSSRSASPSELSEIQPPALAFAMALASHDASHVAELAGQQMDVDEWRRETFGPYDESDVSVTSLALIGADVDSSSPPPVWSARATLAILESGIPHEYDMYLQGTIESGRVTVLGISRSRFHGGLEDVGAPRLTSASS